MDDILDPRRAARLAREERLAAAHAQNAAMDHVKTIVRTAVHRLVLGRRLPPGGPWNMAQAIRQSLAQTLGILTCDTRRLDRDGNRVQILVAGLRTENIDLGRGDEPWLSLSCDRFLIDRRRAIHLDLHGHLLVHAHAQERFVQRQGNVSYTAFCEAVLNALPVCALIALAWPSEGEVMIPASDGVFLGHRLMRPYGPQYQVRAYKTQGRFLTEIDPPPNPLDRPGGRVRLELRTFVPHAALSPSQDAVVEALTRAMTKTPARIDATVALAWTLLLGDTTYTADPAEIEAASAEITNIATGRDWFKCIQRRRQTLAAQTILRRTNGSNLPRAHDAATRSNDGT